EPDPVPLFAAGEQTFCLETLKFVEIGNPHDGWGTVSHLNAPGDSIAGTKAYVPPARVRSMKARAARRISSATRASGDTNFGVNQGNNPIKSWVTRICPSQCSPEPMPIVGIPIALVICFAISATTISSTTENAPAFSTARASASNASTSDCVRPLIL